MNACVKDSPYGANAAADPISEARDDFEACLAATLEHSGTKAGTDLFPAQLSLGAYSPRWSDAEVFLSEDGSTQAVLVPVEDMTHVFRIRFADSTAVFLQPMLVVFKKLDSGQSCAYIRLSTEYRNTTTKLRIWTILDGSLARVVRYDGDSNCLRALSFMDATTPELFKERFEKFGEMIAGMTLERLSSGTKSTLGNEASPDGGFDWDAFYEMLLNNGYTYIDGTWYAPLEPSVCIADAGANTGWAASGGGGFSDCWSGGGSSIPQPTYDDSVINAGGGGGGSGTGNGNSTAPETPPVTARKLAIEKINYLGYGAGNDCFVVAKDILRQFGLSPGGSLDEGNINIFKEYPGRELRKIGDVDKAIDYMKSQIDEGLPVMVGVDYMYKPNSTNINGVDHFLIIYGYGEENGTFYFDYIDTNRSKPNFRAAFGEKFKFYYDSNTGYLDAVHYDYGGDTHQSYKILHIRKSYPL